MSGTFYVIGTPIGNLEDITLRQLDTLATVDFICAEDTRVTLKLLNRFDIKKQLISFHEHSSKADAQRIIDRLLAGESCGIVTDAGMPCISDPGEVLVKLCAEQGIDIKVVPGPSAVVSAVAVSGLSTRRFTFEGFLPVPKKGDFVTGLDRAGQEVGCFEVVSAVSGGEKNMTWVIGIAVPKDLAMTVRNIRPAAAQ